MNEQKPKSVPVKVTAKAAATIDHLAQKYGIQKQKIVEEALERMREAVERDGIRVLYGEECKDSITTTGRVGFQASGVRRGAPVRAGTMSIYASKK